MGADYAFYVKTIETHARTFLPLNISAECSVIVAKFQFQKLNKGHLGQYLRNIQI